jgi:hypothetical protein
VRLNTVTNPPAGGGQFRDCRINSQVFDPPSAHPLLNTPGHENSSTWLDHGCIKVSYRVHALAVDGGGLDFLRRLRGCRVFGDVICPVVINQAW